MDNVDKKFVLSIKSLLIPKVVLQDGRIVYAYRLYKNTELHKGIKQTMKQDTKQTIKRNTKQNTTYVCDDLYIVNSIYLFTNIIGDIDKNGNDKSINNDTSTQKQ